MPARLTSCVDHRTDRAPKRHWRVWYLRFRAHRLWTGRRTGVICLTTLSTPITGVWNFGLCRWSATGSRFCALLGLPETNMTEIFHRTVIGWLTFPMRRDG